MKQIKKLIKVRNKLLSEELGLGFKIDKLHLFLSYDMDYDEISKEEFLLLNSQLKSMIDYYNILGQRIEYLKEKIEVC